MNQPIFNYIPPHLPVLYHETLNALQPKSPGKYIDATVGAGGHSYAILEACSPDGKLLGLDVDPQAINLARKRLEIFETRAVIVEATYINILDIIQQAGWETVQGILFDLGASSMQFDTPERGFSFQSEGPLDMRFNPHQLNKADDLVNHLPEKELANLFWQYGDEPNSRRIAEAVCRSRPIHTTQELAAVIEKSVHRRPGHIHPATRCFQALRISVNSELQSIEKALPLALSALVPGGRLAVITFHSLEDRLVKQFFRRESRDCICSPDQPVCTCSHRASLNELSHRPISPAAEEILANPRSRSAHLRYAEKRKLA